VQLHALPFQGVWGYVANAWTLRRLSARLGTGLLHAHYASGYGVLASLSGCRPRLVSVWGSDVFEFPEISFLHRALLRWVLRSADAVACTSQALQTRVRNLIGPGCTTALTPFGVDWLPVPAAHSEKGQALCVGTVKTLAPAYGIDLLLRAFARIRKARPDDAIPLRLRLVGDGPQRAELERLATELRIAEQVDFVGAVPHAQVAAELQRIDVFVAASRQESFGVAVLEASAAGLPVVVTRVGGLPEVVEDGVTGVLVAPDDVPALAGAIGRLLDDAPLRVRLGAAGPGWVAARYAWPRCVSTMLALYGSLVQARR
jgi:glycosyltransferase involved in cell wall biosynthesis